LNWQKIKGRLDPWSVKYYKSLVGEKKKRGGLENQIHCAYFMCTYDIECFWYVDFYTYEYKLGIGAIPILIGKWQGNICYKAFCMERATHSKTYSGVLGSKQTIHFCSKHLEDAPRSIGEYNYFLENLVFTGGTIAAFLFLIIRIWASVSDNSNPAKNLLLLSFACLLVYIVPTIGAII